MAKNNARSFPKGFIRNVKPSSQNCPIGCLEFNISSRHFVALKLKENLAQDSLDMGERWCTFKWTHEGFLLVISSTNIGFIIPIMRIFCPTSSFQGCFCSNISSFHMLNYEILCWGFWKIGTLDIWRLHYHAQSVPVISKEYVFPKIAHLDLLASH